MMARLSIRTVANRLSPNFISTTEPLEAPQFMMQFPSANPLIPPNTPPCQFAKCINTTRLLIHLPIFHTHPLLYLQDTKGVRGGLSLLSLLSTLPQQAPLGDSLRGHEERAGPSLGKGRGGSSKACYDWLKWLSGDCLKVSEWMLWGPWTYSVGPLGFLLSLIGIFRSWLSHSIQLYR